ncbi:MAG: hypothetical protein KDI45_16020 [Candidatus Accumulibacter sp.]|nr:hypothetical protein [Accumulibacter sp.]MCB1968357.1 hypothetical protein [Accumulibacter sp.]
MPLPTRCAAIGLVMMSLAMPAAAQSLKDVFRPRVVEANPGAEYAQMLKLAATPEFGSAPFDIDDGDHLQQKEDLALGLLWAQAPYFQQVVGVQPERRAARQDPARQRLHVRTGA